MTDDASSVKIGPDRRIHILDGDKTGGGHRFGSGGAKSSEFPPDWSDDRIIAAVQVVANDPASVRTVQPNGRMRIEGMHDGVTIRVIVDTDSRSIRTAHPVHAISAR